MANTMKRVHVFYSGRVQGVGFRMTADEAAKAFGVVGWVKNHSDGRVELVAEATQEALDAFLSDVRQGPMKNFITDIEISWSPAANNFREFTIRYY